MSLNDSSADRRLSALDASFLYYEQPNQPLHVGSVAILDGPVDLGALRTMLGERLGRLPRYRQHPVRSLLDLTMPRWEDDDVFDPARHVFHARVPAPGDEAALHATIDALFAMPCDLDRSPWETHLIDGLADGRTAILSKVHHCMIDGVSGAQVLELMTDPAHGPAGTGAVPASAAALPALRTPPAPLLARLRDAVAAVSEMSALTASPVGPLPFTGTLSPRRRVRWNTFALDEILALRGAAGCKVNDVVLALVTGALRAHLLARGTDPDRVRVRALVPVSVRAADEHLALGNRVSAMFATLPTDLEHPLARLHAVANETRRLKHHGQPQALGLAMTLASALPAPTGPVVASLASRFPLVHTVCTNVPGPREPRFVLGRRVVALHPIVPIGLDMGMGFAILSYDRELSISITADPDLVPEPESVTAGLRAAADELHAVLGTRPADDWPATASGGTSVGDLMSRHLVTVVADASLADAWTLMERRRSRHRPVVGADGGLVGLLTHRDLLAAAQSRVTFPDEADRLRMLGWARVGDVMETHLCTVTSNAAAADAAARMAALKIGCLPVVDDGRLAGMLTEHDFLRWVSVQGPRESA
jgi:WS/DGAT/MGAT family acyltransferase